MALNANHKDLTPCPPIVGETMETARYVACDLCFHSATADIYAAVSEGERTGKYRAIDEADWRKFYRSQAEGLIVCERCLAEYWREDDGN